MTDLRRRLSQSAGRDDDISDTVTDRSCPEKVCWRLSASFSKVLLGNTNLAFKPWLVFYETFSRSLQLRDFHFACMNSTFMADHETPRRSLSTSRNCVGFP